MLYIPCFLAPVGRTEELQNKQIAKKKPTPAYLGRLLMVMLYFGLTWNILLIRCHLVSPLCTLYRCH